MHQRLGIPYSEQMERSWIKMIQEGKVPLIEKQSNRVSVWAVPVYSPFHEVPEQIHVVYDYIR